MSRPRLVPALALALAVATCSAFTVRALAPPETSTVATPAAAITSPRSSYTPPREKLLFTDPVHRSHAVSNAISRLAASTPAGGSIEISTYFLGSQRIERALEGALHRGVRVRAVLAQGPRRHYPASRRLAEVLNRDPRDGSWLRWSPWSSRGTYGIDHQKIYRFSQVGGRRWVTVAGSMNSSSTADRAAYGQMLLVSSRAVYRDFAGVFRESARDRPVPGNPLRRFRGDRWSGYVLPTAGNSPAVDPVIERLDAIPAVPSTRIAIEMYSMWDPRGLWIADKLAAMARAGAHISFLAGPTVSPEVVADLTGSGVEVHGGCYSDGTYVHAKDMTASFVRNGKRHRWTWIGSDNWTSQSQENDEAVLGIESAPIHRQFLRDFGAMWNRPGSVMPWDCHPLSGRG